MKNFAKLCLLALVTVHVTLCIGQTTSTDTWRNMMDHCGVSFETIYAECPSFPKVESYINDEDYSRALEDWQNNHPEELETFWSIEAIQTCNPSPFYLGLSDGEVEDQFDNSMWQWVEGSGITDTRLMEIAPHFPKPEITGNFDADELAYNAELEIWSYLYPLEYEALINCDELTALNPYYEGYVVLSVLPKFIGAKIDSERPQFIDTGNAYVDRLSFELKMQNWLFVYHPEKFQKRYGYEPRFPETFDAEDYREEVKDRIENPENYEGHE